MSRRPSAAFVLAFVALLVALGGTAVAASHINGKDIRNKSIAGIKLKNQSVGTAQLRNGAVQARDIQTGAVTVSKIRQGAVTRSKIAANAVTSNRIAPGAVVRADIAPSARVPSVIVRQSVVQGVVNNAVAETTASCNPGEVLISGGAGPISSPAAGLAVVASRPQPVGAAPTSWLVIMGNQSGATAEFSAYAVCATRT